MGDFTAFSGCAGESGCFGASAIAPAVALLLFATIFLTDFLLAVDLANKSIFVADGFTDELARALEQDSRDSGPLARRGPFPDE